jgi:predicted nuclease with TOPRIM domain
MAKHLGRPLEKWEIVHHRNNIRDDNRLDNLELVTHLENLQIRNMQEHIKTLESENKTLSQRVTQLEAEVELLRIQLSGGEVVNAASASPPLR